jgi:hypothetical protein
VAVTNWNSHPLLRRWRKVGDTMMGETPNTHQKALKLNLDSKPYGTFAEIGAGQEVARWFFRVGGAAGTIAKSMSAYDMVVSDSIYGKSTRYVSRERVQAMLRYEYDLVLERLDTKRGAETCFFAFANTVAASSYSRPGEGMGWLGIRFQHEPRAEPSEVVIHAALLEPENVQQQEALGILGVNLIYGAIYLHQSPTDLIDSLLDGLSSKRALVDVVGFSGPAFEGVDSRLMCLHLVQNGLTPAALFTAEGKVVQASEILHKKPILVLPGSFQPVTKVAVDMLERSLDQFLRDTEHDRESVVVLLEMTLKTLATESGVEHKNFLERVDMLRLLGQPILISNYLEFYRLATALHRFAKEKIGIAMGVPSLYDLFEEKYYENLAGGILESFGRMFKNELRLYVYPLLNPDGSVTTADKLEVAPNLRHLYEYLLDNHLIEPITDYNKNCLPIFSRQVLAKIQAGDASWENEVPAVVAAMIKEKKLLGYRESGETAKAK